MDVKGSFEEKEKVQEMALSIHFSEACAVVLVGKERKKASSENKAVAVPKKHNLGLQDRLFCS